MFIQYLKPILLPLQNFKVRNNYILITYFLFFIVFGFFLFGSQVFGRFLAYVAVFHFIRQQYGFMRLYSLEMKPQPWTDNFIIYTATIYLSIGFVS
jgi:polyferredoxin